MTTRSFTHRLLLPPFPTVKKIQPLSVGTDDDLLDADSDIFGISTTLRSPRLRLLGKSSARVLDLVLAYFATLSDPLFIQDRRFIQSHGWWYFLSSTTALLATSCRTGEST